MAHEGKFFLDGAFPTGSFALISSTFSVSKVCGKDESGCVKETKFSLQK
ncbi:hypothetical protein Ocin01_04699 [Orchesella cincta]|uniref:Uncharacterized protein n=1 Tax=Orchesella cincta TaxID=48709 RepID=A0A1D2N9Q4_ORCCI|nr:hypothetical protein Ocin01_04699 [Orchesella cincta]